MFARLGRHGADAIGFAGAVERSARRAVTAVASDLALASLDAVLASRLTEEALQRVLRSPAAERVVVGVLEAPLAERALSTVLSGPLVDSFARDLTRHAVVERIAGEALSGEVVDTVTAGILARDTVERVLARVEASGVADRVAARVLEGPELERLIASVVDSPGTERLVARVIDSRLLETTFTRLLESQELWLLVEEIARSPAVTEAITQQSLGFADQMAAEVRRGSSEADACADARTTPPSADTAREGTYAGLVTRALAYAVDAAIVNLVAFVVAAVARLALSLVGRIPSSVETILAVAGGVAYVAWLAIYSWPSGRRPGRRRVRASCESASSMPVERPT